MKTSNTYVSGVVDVLPVLDRMIVESIQVGKVFFYAIPDRFSDVAFGDFIQIDALHQAAEIAITEKKPDALEKMTMLCAAIYRKTRLEEITISEIKHRAKEWTKDPETVVAIFANYRKMREWISGQYPALFPQAESRKSFKKSKGTAVASQWLEWRDHLAVTFHVTPSEANKIKINDALRFINRSLKK